MFWLNRVDAGLGGSDLGFREIDSGARAINAGVISLCERWIPNRTALWRR
jgi:hypothetical protein